MLWFGREKGVREKERGSATLGFDLFLFCFVLNFSPILSLSLSLCPPPFFFLGGGGLLYLPRFRTLFTSSGDPKRSDRP